MKGRLAIAATIGALLATVGAAGCAALAHSIDLGGAGVAALALCGGGLLGLAAVAGVVAVPPPGVEAAGGSAAPAGVEPVRPPPPPPAIDVERLAMELERLANARSSDLELAPEAVPGPLLLAVQQIADRIAEDQRKAAGREIQLREATARHAELVRHLHGEVERQREHAQVAQRVRDAFLTRMSHELRTPLNAILGYLELIAEEYDHPPLQADVARVRSSALSLLATVTTVLDLTQLESNAFDVIPEALDLGDLVRKVEASVQADAEAHGNALSVEVQDLDGFEIRLDRRMVQSILHNLTANAVKYTQGGTVTVRVAPEGERIRILVADTGIGMTQRQIDEAFRPFGQGDESTTRRYDGAGLGLAVVRGFADAMGGQVRIESAPGQGARVWVDLPRVCAPRASTLNEDDPTMLVR